MKLKKIIALLSLFALLLSLAACGSKNSASPAETMDGIMQELISCDDEMLEEIFTEDLMAEEGMMLSEDDVEFSKEIYKIMLSQLSYKITDVSENGDTAIVTMEITNVDYAEAFSAFFANAISKVMPYTLMSEEQRPSDEEMMEIMKECFLETYQSKDLSKVTNTVKIKMTYEDDMWYFESNDDFVDAITGGAMSFIDDLEE